MGDVSQIKIVFQNSDVFDTNEERRRLTGHPKSFNKNIKEVSALVDQLDRDDEYDSLLIPTSAYEKKGSVYGIERNDDIHPEDGVILPGQKRAAERFLKELNGFGLLADSVGSGKTYEAGVVLSELCARDHVRSILFIVPDVLVDKWVSLMELGFGLGKGSILRLSSSVPQPSGSTKAIYEQMKNETLKSDDDKPGYTIPHRPCIVSTQDFAKWKSNDLLGTRTRFLFDMLVVDEVHQITNEKEEHSRAMHTLLQLMSFKKDDGHSFALLLSATPHDGNLANMFRLWYFIRCKDIDLDDFKEGATDISDDYNDELKHYTDDVCLGAKNIRQFVNNATVIHVQKDSFTYQGKQYNVLDVIKSLLPEEICNIFDDLGYNQQFEYIQNALNDRYQLLSKNDYGGREFLRELKRFINRQIREHYHQRVLGSIMIRTHGRENISINKEKYVTNYYFYPVQNDIPKSITIKNFLDGNMKDVVLDVDKYIKGEKCFRYDGNSFTYQEFLEEAMKVSNQPSINYVANHFNEAFIKQFIDKDFNNNPFFTKSGSLAFYNSQMLDNDSNILNMFIPVQLVNKNAERFSYRFNQFLTIANKHKNQRMLVFFDYDLDPNKSYIPSFVKQIDASNLKKRVIFAAKEDKGNSAILNKFNESEDAILVVLDAGYTHGIDLQKAAVLVNFETTHDPVEMEQRVGRIFRVGQESDINIYSFADSDQLEGYALAYFNRIGIMSSTTGDATIIAGCTSEEMVTVRCDQCGSVKLLSKEDYDAAKDPNSPMHQYIMCPKAGCLNKEPMGQICTFEFKCAKCGHVINRVSSDTVGGTYKCETSNNLTNSRNALENHGTYKDRKYFCKKACILANCHHFKAKVGFGKCDVVNKFIEANKEGRTLDDADFIKICCACTNQVCLNDDYTHDNCCYSVAENRGYEGVRKCLDCVFIKEHECNPKPFILEFDDNWQATCPKCHDDYLKPVASHSFSTFIQYLWKAEEDANNRFCQIMTDEINKIVPIRDVLIA